jgi:hypothetical protein
VRAKANRPDALTRDVMSILEEGSITVQLLCEHPALKHYRRDLIVIALRSLQQHHIAIIEKVIVVRRSLNELDTFGATEKTPMLTSAHKEPSSNIKPIRPRPSNTKILALYIIKGMRQFMGTTSESASIVRIALTAARLTADAFYRDLGWKGLGEATNDEQQAAKLLLKESGARL